MKIKFFCKYAVRNLEILRLHMTHVVFSCSLSCQLHAAGEKKINREDNVQHLAAIKHFDWKWNLIKMSIYQGHDDTSWQKLYNYLKLKSRYGLDNEKKQSKVLFLNFNFYFSIKIEGQKKNEQKRLKLINNIGELSCFKIKNQTILTNQFFQDTKLKTLQMSYFDMP